MGPGRLLIIAVDTDVLVRYLTNDDAEQARKAVALLASADTILLTPNPLLKRDPIPPVRTVHSIYATRRLSRPRPQCPHWARSHLQEPRATNRPPPPGRPIRLVASDLRS